MENFEQELAAELEHYHDVCTIIHKQLDKASDNYTKSEKILQETNRDMWENASHAAADFDGAVNLSQYYQPLANDILALESNAEQVRRLIQMQGSAYFASIDYRMQGEEEYERFYIGKSTLRDKHQIYIYDWRAPIASLFYRFERGNAFYDAPGGRVTGDIARKRQYEIKKGVFEYFFDADIQIADEFLRKMLSGNTSGKMKAIVETIQKDQDIAIRDMTHDLLMIQGIAGSGKTSVALHRVAYLKYQGLARRMQSDHILILSPNRLFQQYISNVLPELGEDEVQSAVFDDLVKGCLPGQIIFKTSHDQAESLILSTDPAEKATAKNVMEFKLSNRFIKILNRYAESLPQTHISFTNIVYDGQTVFTAEVLKDLLLHMTGNITLGDKLKKLRQLIFEKIHELRKERLPKLLKQAQDNPEHPFDWEEYARVLSIAEHTCLARQVDKFVELNSLAFYKKLIQADDLLLSLAEDIKLPDNIEDIIHSSRKQLTPEVLQYEDALAIAYLQLLIDPRNCYQSIRQVVVDEAQDYYDMHFEILKRLFKNAWYTLLGDVNQTIGKEEDMGMYERIAKIIKPRSACLIQMNKSFRCTKEILSFGMQYLDSKIPFRSFNRSGHMPQVIRAADIRELDEKILAEADYGVRQGYQTIGIICKETRQAEMLYERLKEKINLQLVTLVSEQKGQGVFVIPLIMSKGLEFDVVMIYGTDDEHYHSKEDRKLLYIACTRALHRLNLFYTGRVSPFVGKEDCP